MWVHDVQGWCSLTEESFSPLLKTEMSSASLKLCTAHYSSPGNRQPALQLFQPISIDVTAFSACRHEKWPLKECETPELSSWLWWHQKPTIYCRCRFTWHKPYLWWNKCFFIVHKLHHSFNIVTRNALSPTKKGNQSHQAMSDSKTNNRVMQLVDCSTAAIWWRLLIDCWTIRCPGCEARCSWGSSLCTQHTAERQRAERWSDGSILHQDSFFYFYFLDKETFAQNKCQAKIKPFLSKRH